MSDSSSRPNQLPQDVIQVVGMDRNGFINRYLTFKTEDKDGVSRAVRVFLTEGDRFITIRRYE